MRIAVLALQGAFIEHERILSKLGVESFEIRKLSDWNGPKSGLIIPGGESTTQSKLLTDLDLLSPIKKDIANGLPVFGTCAGLILLAKDVKGGDFLRFSTMDIEVNRNAYGRQLASFYVEESIKGIGENVPMTFIRAPYIERVYGEAEALGETGGHVVVARQDNQLVTAFHPELNDDTRIHQYFINMVREYR